MVNRGAAARSDHIFLIFHDFSQSSRAAFLGIPGVDEIADRAGAHLERLWMLSLRTVSMSARRGLHRALSTVVVGLALAELHQHARRPYI
jgi:hypothetical protein